MPYRRRHPPHEWNRGRWLAYSRKALSKSILIFLWLAPPSALNLCTAPGLGERAWLERSWQIGPQVKNLSGVRRI